MNSKLSKNSNKKKKFPLFLYKTLRRLLRDPLITPKMINYIYPHIKLSILQDMELDSTGNFKYNHIRALVEDIGSEFSMKELMSCLYINKSIFYGLSNKHKREEGRMKKLSIRFFEGR